MMDPLLSQRATAGSPVQVPMEKDHLPPSRGRKKTLANVTLCRAGRSLATGWETASPGEAHAPVGVGLIFRREQVHGSASFVVDHTAEGSPADRARSEGRLGAEDQLVAVDGMLVADWPFEDVIRKINGPAGSSVVLTLLRRGGRAAMNSTAGSCASPAIDDLPASSNRESQTSALTSSPSPSRPSSFDDVVSGSTLLRNGTVLPPLENLDGPMAVQDTLQKAHVVDRHCLVAANVNARTRSTMAAEGAFDVAAVNQSPRVMEPEMARRVPTADGETMSGAGSNADEPERVQREVMPAQSCLPVLDSPAGTERDWNEGDAGENFSPGKPYASLAWACTQCAGLKEQVSDLSQELSLARQQVQQKNEEVQCLHEDYEIMVAGLREQVRSKDVVITQLELQASKQQHKAADDISYSMHQAEELRAEIVDLKLARDEAFAVINRFESDNAALNTQIAGEEKMQGEISMLNAQNDQLRADLEGTRESSRLLKAKNRKLVLQLSSEREEWCADRDAQQRKIDALEFKCRNLMDLPKQASENELNSEVPTRLLRNLDGKVSRSPRTADSILNSMAAMESMMVLSSPPSNRNHGHQVQNVENAASLDDSFNYEPLAANQAPALSGSTSYSFTPTDSTPQTSPAQTHSLGLEEQISMHVHANKALKAQLDGSRELISTQMDMISSLKKTVQKLKGPGTRGVGACSIDFGPGEAWVEGNAGNPLDSLSRCENVQAERENILFLSSSLSELSSAHAAELRKLESSRTHCEDLVR